jgi:hypothetical protein
MVIAGVASARKAGGRAGDVRLGVGDVLDVEVLEDLVVGLVPDPEQAAVVGAAVGEGVVGHGTEGHAPVRELPLVGEAGRAVVGDDGGEGHVGALHEGARSG